jgi:alkanesulfonate monooxygenase SsuD/methylene tetrahydromethanopterin reductase-like flavin-dependent oxidoreductase (luciferase family)
MGSTSVVESARRALGPVGVFMPFSRASAVSADRQREAVRRLENAGYRAAWANEGVGGKDALVQLAVLLAATERMVFGTSIANIWARAPQTAHGAAALLSQAFPSRFVLGLGVGYPHQAASVGREFGSPVATMRDYLDQMSAPTQLPAPEVAYPKIIGANGAKLLALAAEIADGALPAVVPPAFTAETRQLLGPGQAPGGRAGRRRGRRPGPGQGDGPADGDRPARPAGDLRGRHGAPGLLGAGHRRRERPPGGRDRRVRRRGGDRGQGA